ncbi:MAG: sigma-70 family RNA polymerase sigma factor [Rikenellaceae bacterium]|nr:sigma-70 family RNA polymerase sigma factor [Rikenellaceae bacterium]
MSQGINNEDTFFKVIDKYKSIFIKISNAYAKNNFEKEELINDMIFEVRKSHDNFRGESKFSTWLYRVAVNTAMNHARRKKYRFLSLTDYPVSMGDELKVIEYEKNTEVEILYYCIEQLNNKDKALIILYLEGLTHNEISEITGVTKTNVGTRIQRIKEKLKK